MAGQKAREWQGKRQMSAWPGSWLSFSSAEPGPGARGGVLKYFLNIQKYFFACFVGGFWWFFGAFWWFLMIFDGLWWSLYVFAWFCGAFARTVGRVG